VLQRIPSKKEAMLYNGCRWMHNAYSDTVNTITNFQAPGKEKCWSGHKRHELVKTVCMIYGVSYDVEEVWHHHSRDNNAKKSLHGMRSLIWINEL
jgi:hypothetical protein